MDKTNFGKIRRHLGKTQQQMAHLLGISLKAVQSFEQGWRNIPAYVERQILFLLAIKGTHDNQREKPCWESLQCPESVRQNCPAWELRAQSFCWMINGTVCKGEPCESWKQKMDMCKKCEVFRSAVSLDGE